MTVPLAYTIQEAAASCGVSEKTIRRAMANGDLIAKYPTSRPVIPADELRDWIDRAPSQPRSA